MLLAEQYLRLRRTLDHVRDGEEVSISLPELEEIFVCSSRNCQMIMQKLLRTEWITWTPGRGRGNRSLLSFRQNREELLLQTAKSHVEKGQLKEAIQFVDTYAATDWERAQFHDWLGRQFGYQPLFIHNQRVDTVRLFFPYPFFCLDPAQIQYSFQKHIVNQLFDRLVRFDKEKQLPEPSLAHYWEANSKGDVWRFYLRKGILFHHGKELNAHDVCYTLLRLKQLSTQLPGLSSYEAIRKVVNTGEYSLEIELQQANHGFIHYLASERASIIPKGICEEMGERFSLQPLGTGPFRVERNDCDLLVLHAHDTYFQGRAHLDQIELWVVADEELTRKSVSEDAYNIHLGAKTEQETSWKSITRQAVGCKMLFWNRKKNGWGCNERFRQALFSAVDQKAFLEQLGNENMLPADRLIGGALEAPREAASKEEVNSLLQASGYKGEAIRLYTYSFQRNEQEAEWLAKQWEQFGIRVEITVFAPHEFGSTEFFEQADLFLYYQAADENKELFLLEMYASPGSILRRYFSQELNRKIDDDVPGIVQEAAASRRLARLERLEQQIKQDWAVQFLYHRHERASYHPSLQGVTLNALGWVSFKDIWFQDKAANSV